ncbi:MAG: FCD domain-containing protein [Rhodocyclaceae bacterium]|jgi:phosphonate utilization transcriptional regulator|nr:FCD domain-containing protein [Rhodocyclaceae bacterium]
MNAHASAIALLQSRSLPGLIQQQLERMILDGELPPGSQLTEIPLAARLGVSRGPVREAFRGLEEKGLVRVEKNRGVFVRTIAPDEADAIYEVRLALEELIVRKLAAVPDAVRAAGLEKLLAEAEKFAKKANFAACHECNVAFHDRLVCLTGNPALIDSYRRLVGELSLFRHQAHASIPDASSLRASVADHRAILAALCAGERAMAARLLRRHVEASRKRLQRLLKNQ